MRINHEVLTFSDAEQDLVAPQNFVAELTDFITSQDKNTLLHPTQLEQTQYATLVSKTNSGLPAPSFYVQLFDQETRQPLPCYLIFMAEVQNDQLTVQGYYSNEAKRRFRKVSALLSPVDDALCQALANISAKKVSRIIKTHKSPIMKLMEGRKYLHAGKKGQFTIFVKTFEPQEN